MRSIAFIGLLFLICSSHLAAQAIINRGNDNNTSVGAEFIFGLSNDEGRLMTLNGTATVDEVFDIAPFYGILFDNDFDRRGSVYGVNMKLLFSKEQKDFTMGIQGQLESQSGRRGFQGISVLLDSYTVLSDDTDNNIPDAIFQFSLGASRIPRTAFERGVKPLILAGFLLQFGEVSNLYTGRVFFSRLFGLCCDR